MDNMHVSLFRTPSRIYVTNFDRDEMLRYARRMGGFQVSWLGDPLRPLSHTTSKSHWT